MLTESSRSKIQDILKRLAKGNQISLQERVYVDKFADNDQTVANWLNRARRLQRNSLSENGIDDLLNQLDLCSPDPQTSYMPEEDDLGEWFAGAPSWLSRS